MAKVCLSPKQVFNDPKFIELQKALPRYRPMPLLNYLGMYRSTIFTDEANTDWYPGTEFLPAFTEFIHRKEREAEIQKALKNTERGNSLANYSAVLAAYTPSQIDDAVDMIVSKFEDYVSAMVKENADSDYSRNKLIEEYGGVSAIFDKMFESFANIKPSEIYNEIVREDDTPAKKAELLERARRNSEEQHNLVKFKSYFIARSISKISELENLKVDYKGIIADWKEEASAMTAESDAEETAREEGESKGARYIDARFKSISQSLSAEVKRLINDIEARDYNGRRTTTIFGKYKTLDYHQVAIPLVKILEHAKPDTFITVLENAQVDYPWVTSLLTRLKGDSEEKAINRALIYTNFKKNIRRYSTIYEENDKYKVGIANSGAKDSAIARDMLVNMSGNTLSPDSIYDFGGDIRRSVDYDKLLSKAEVPGITLVEMRPDKDPVDPKAGQFDNNKDVPQYAALTGEDSMRMFIEQNKDKLHDLLDACRAIGIDIGYNDIEACAMSPMPKQSKDWPSAKNRLEVLSKAVQNVIKAAKSGKYENTDQLHNIIKNELSAINFSLFRAMQEELEIAVLVDGKPLRAAQNVNLTSQVTDTLSNVDDLDDKAYRQALWDTFGQFEGYSLNGNASEENRGNLLTGWLKKLYQNPRLAKTFVLEQQITFNGVEYARMSKEHKLLSCYLRWKSSGGYDLPIAADYEHAHDFILAPGLSPDAKTQKTNPAQRVKYKSDSMPFYDAETGWYDRNVEIIRAFADEVKIELETIKAIEDRANLNHKELSTYEERGQKFWVFPEFNDNGFRDTYTSIKKASEAEDFLLKSVAQQLQKIVDKEVENVYNKTDLHNNPYLKDMFGYTEWNADVESAADYYKRVKEPYEWRKLFNTATRSEFQQFVAEYYFARIQMTNLYSGGFRNFPSRTEFEKRNMFRYAPRTSLYGMRDQNVLYIEDEKLASKYHSELDAMVDQLYDAHKITLRQSAMMKAANKSINTTDGQAIRTMESHIALLKSMGQWREDVEGAALRRIKEGKPRPSDIDLFLFNGKKMVGTGFQYIPAADGENQKPIRNPFLHKANETVLMAPFLAKYCLEARSEFSRGLNSAVEQLRKSSGINIDLFMFHSGCKIGFTSPLNPLATETNEDGSITRTFDTADKIASYIVEQVKSDPERYVQHIPSMYYGEAANLAKPEADNRIVLGQQAVKAVFSNVEDDEEIVVGGKTRSASEMMHYYDKLEAAEVVEAYRKCCEILDTPQELEILLQSEVASKPYSKDDMMYALSLQKDGRFVTDLYDPSVRHDVESMVFSIINKRMTRPANKGNHLVVTSAIGMEKSLAPFSSDRFKEEDQLGVQFETTKDGTRFLGVESYVPIFDSRLKIFADKNGMIPPERLRQLVADGRIPEKLLHFILGRTPADEKHSLLPGIIKGFTTKIAGSRGYFSKEIDELTGGDKDGDELHTYYYDFDLVWMDDRIKRLYDTLPVYSNPNAEDYMSFEDFSEAFKKKGSALRKDLRKNYSVKWQDYQKIELVDYDYDKDPFDQAGGDRARWNARLDILIAMQTSLKGSEKTIIPGSNADTEMLAKSIDLTNRMVNDDELKDQIKKIAGSDEVKVELDTKNAVSIFDSLMNLDLKKLQILYEASQANENPYSLSYSIESFQRLMSGATSIDVNALYNGAGQLLQRAKLAYKESVSKTGELTHVSILGHTLGELYPIYCYEGQEHSQDDRTFSSLAQSRLLQTAVDNPKNPLLALINSTKELAPITNFILAGGFGERRLDLIMTQPVMVRLAERLQDRRHGGFVTETKRIIAELEGNTEVEERSLRIKQKAAIKKMASFTEEDFINGFTHNYSELTEKNSGLHDIKMLQICLLKTLNHVYSAAMDLDAGIRTLRPDTSSGTVGPDFPHTLVRLDRLNKFRDKVESGRCRILGFEDIVSEGDLPEDDSDAALLNSLESPLYKITAINALMYGRLLRDMKKYFPQANPGWHKVALEIAALYERGKENTNGVRSVNWRNVRTVIDDMVTWKIISQTNYIGDVESRREELLDTLPDRLAAIKKRRSDAFYAERSGGEPTDKAAAKLIGNTFVSKLVKIKTSDGFRLAFRPGGFVTQPDQAKFTAGWADLLNSEDEEIKQFAIDLWDYGMLTNGLHYGMYEFMHMAPLAIESAVSDYREARHNILETDFSKNPDDTNNFIRQFKMNHWQDTDLVPHFNAKQLPNGLREQFGLKSITDSKKHPTVDLNKIRNNYDYIAVRDITEDGVYVTRLYRLITDPESMLTTAIEVQKLGKSGKYGQASIHYNPTVREVDAFDARTKQRAEDGPMPSYVTDPDGLGDHVVPSFRSIGFDAPAVPNVRANETETNNAPSFGAMGFAAPRVPANIQKEKANVDELAKKAEEAAQKNETVIDYIPERTVAEGAEIEEAEINYGPLQNYEEYENPGEWDDEEQTAEPEPNSEPVPTSGPYMQIAVRDGDSVKTVSHPATPWAVELARKQQVYVSLGKKLRAILQSHGIATGPLSSLEVRMGYSGVTDFDSAVVTAEGLKELIRLANGDKGEMALPEEFSHWALETLGYDHPLVQRLMNAINNNEEAMTEAFGDQYDEYLNLYNGDTEKMRREAAGKLVAKELLYQEKVQTGWLRSLIHRICEAIKELLRKIGIVQINDAMLESRNVASQIAKDLLGGRLDDMLKQDKVMSGKYYNKEKKDIDDKQDILHKILKIEIERRKILKTRLSHARDENNRDAITETEEAIEQLEQAIKGHKTESAIISYMGNTMSFLAETEKSLDGIISNTASLSQASVSAICKRIAIARDTINGFSESVFAVRKAIQAGELQDTQAIQNSMMNVDSYLGKLLTKVNDYGLEFFQRTLRNFYGREGVTIMIGKDRGKRISIEEMSTTAPKDVSLFSRWLHSMANCNDLVLKAIDGIVSRAKYDARADANRIRVMVTTAFEELYRATGSKDQSFMFEYVTGKDGKKHKTGKYISEQDSKKLTPAQKRFYDSMMELKKGIDKYCPESLVSDRKIVMLRKHAIEKAHQAETFAEKGKYVGDAIKNTVLDTSDEIDFDYKEVLLDFEGNKVDKLPILYTNKGKHETFDDMTEDVATSIVAYGASMSEYAHMNLILGEIENAKYMNSQRRVQQRAGSRIQRETITGPDTVHHKPYTIPGAQSNIQKVLEDFFTMHVYNHTMADEGYIGRTRISKGKVANTINAVTSMAQLGFNLTQRIANVSVGQAQILIQAGKTGMFTEGDILWASKEYLALTADRIMDTGKLESDNYLSLFNQKFDIRQDNGRQNKNVGYSKSWAARNINTNLMYVGLQAGEDYLASVTAIAIAHNKKVLNADGKEDTFWNAYEIKYSNPKEKTGAYLSLKKGWKNLDGTPITSDDEYRFSRKCAGANQDMQGIYNLDDKSAIQQYSLGSLVMMYRKWIMPAIKIRYGEAQYNSFQDKWTEGYWRTMAKHLKDSFTAIYTMLRQGEGLKNGFKINYDKLTSYEKSNITRALRELSILVGTVVAIGLLEKYPPDNDARNDKSPKNWAYSMFLYQLYRLRNELGSQDPTYMMPQELLKILRTPFAAMSMLENTLEVFRLFLPTSYTTIVKSGAYKGHSYAYKYFWGMPLLSVRKQIQHFIDPDPSIQYFKNDVI